MFANRFTALLDACSLAGALSRNTLLSLAEAELFRARWSREILDETERAIAKILIQKSDASAELHASHQITRIESAFPEGSVMGFEELEKRLNGCLCDPNDTHVLAAAVKCRASIIVTDNTKHFPETTLKDFDIEALTADEFIANTIDLSQQKAVAAIAEMRGRFQNPEIDGHGLLLIYEKRGLLQTADILRDHVMNL